MKRTFRPITVLLFGLVFLVGCGNSDQKTLTPLFDNMQAQVIGKLRPEITALPTAEERSYTLFRDQYQDQHRVIVDFIDTNPKLSDSTMQLVENWRDATREVYEYYDQFVANRNFELNESQRERGKALQQDSISLLIELENIAKGGA